VCTCASGLGMCVNSLSLYMVAWYSDLDSFVRPGLGNGRFQICAVMDPIH